eukprot:scaffold127376_cov17-Tisochrysis_lutea.AAC.1
MEASGRLVTIDAKACHAWGRFACGMSMLQNGSKKCSIKQAHPVLTAWTPQSLKMPFRHNK